MVLRVGINGFGRIGRLVCRAIAENHSDIEVVGINNPGVNPENMAYLFKNDSVHGKFKGEVIYTEDELIINEMVIKIFGERNPANIPWEAVSAEYICESTGLFRTFETASKHLLSGAKKVIISAPSKDENVPMFVKGVNEEKYNSDMLVVSNASCTTNCLAPLVKVLNTYFSIDEALMTTIHASTSTQTTVDGYSKVRGNVRIGRNMNNIIPTSTGAAEAVSKVIPELEGKMTGLALRVPVSNVSIVDLTVRFHHDTSYENIIQALKNESMTSLKGILAVEYEPLVSQDFVHNSHSSIVDVKAGIELNSKFFKILSWYDNEWGYSNRLVELMKHMYEVDNLEK